MRASMFTRSVEGSMAIFGSCFSRTVSGGRGSGMRGAWHSVIELRSVREFFGFLQKKSTLDHLLDLMAEKGVPSNLIAATRQTVADEKMVLRNEIRASKDLFDVKLRALNEEVQWWQKYEHERSARHLAEIACLRLLVLEARGANHKRGLFEFLCELYMREFPEICKAGMGWQSRWNHILEKWPHLGERLYEACGWKPEEQARKLTEVYSALSSHVDDGRQHARLVLDGNGVFQGIRHPLTREQASAVECLGIPFDMMIKFVENPCDILV